ncbi:MAG TPA: Rv2175c family DNA-binding protein [Sporichthyaceae bacterium]|nr:Rv2175c family DNA-binding protein [Sporichthyaceae bacterium]
MVNEESVRTDPVEAAVSRWLTLPEVAEELGVDAARARQLYADRQFLARRRGERRVLSVPAEFLADGALLKGLPGTLTLLADVGYSDEEALAWLFTEDPTLPGRPVEALRANRGREVRRRAQASAF